MAKKGNEYTVIDMHSDDYAKLLRAQEMFFRKERQIIDDEYQGEGEQIKIAIPSELEDIFENYAAELGLKYKETNDKVIQVFYSHN